MPSSTYRHRFNTTPMIITLIILIHANLREVLTSPVPITSLDVAPSRSASLREAAHLIQHDNQFHDNTHSRQGRYYHANPSILTSYSNQNAWRQIEGDASKTGGGINRGVAGDRQQQAAHKGRRPVRNVHVIPRVGLGDQDLVENEQDYDYGHDTQEIEDISSSYPDKRGFSVLARWKPFTNISKMRVSSRQQQLLRPTMIQQAQAQAQQMLTSAADDYDVISAETRALLLRPSGQPLRWG